MVTVVTVTAGVTAGFETRVVLAITGSSEVAWACPPHLVSVVRATPNCLLQAERSLGRCLWGPFSVASSNSCHTVPVVFQEGGPWGFTEPASDLTRACWSARGPLPSGKGCPGGRRLSQLVTCRLYPKRGFGHVGFQRLLRRSTPSGNLAVPVPTSLAAHGAVCQSAWRVKGDAQ